MRITLNQLTSAILLACSMIGVSQASVTCEAEFIRQQGDPVTTSISVNSVQNGGAACIENAGVVQAENISAGIGVYVSSPGEGSAFIVNTASGSVVATRDDAFFEAIGIGTFLNTNNSVIQNFGSISVTSDSRVFGISFSDEQVSILNQGAITVTAIGSGPAAGIAAAQGVTASSMIVNSGNISVSAPAGAISGIDSTGGQISNSGTITVSGNMTSATGISSLQSQGVSNTGTILAALQNGRAVGIFGQTGAVTNTGTVTASVSGSQVNNLAIGMDMIVLGSSAALTNTGTISARTERAPDGSDRAVSVQLTGNNVTFTNSGTLKAEGSTARAIDIMGTGSVVNINAGSIIVGDLYTDRSGNTLKFDVGASKGYVFETTGDWILEDLDGRAVVKGSAMAASIGQAETADEMLFERTQLFLQSIDRGQMRRDLSGESAAWVDPYAFDSKRSASSSDPTVVKYGSNGYGLTLGYDFKAFGIKAQAIGNIQWGKLNIDDNTQDIDSTSWLVGLRLPSFYEAGLVSFSAMAFAGRNQYSSDNQVLTNTTSSGTTTYSSSFGSTQLLFGLGAKYSTPITDNTNLSLKADLYLSQEYLESYKEGPYFSWNSRTLTQGSAFVEAGVDHQLTDQWLVQAKVGANTQTLMSGKEANYSINNTPVTFSGGQTSDTGLYGMLGTQYWVKDNAQVGLSVWYGQTNNSVKTIQGMLEAKFLF